MADIEWNVTTNESCDKSGDLIAKNVWIDRADKLWIGQGEILRVRSHVVDKRAIREKIVETVKIGRQEKQLLVMTSFLKICTHHGAVTSVERFGSFVPELDASIRFDPDDRVTEYVGPDCIGAVSLRNEADGYFPVAFPPRTDEELQQYPTAALMKVSYGKHSVVAGYLALSSLTQSIQVAKFL